MTIGYYDVDQTDYDEPKLLTFGYKTFEDYGRHAVVDADTPSPFDVFRFIGFGNGVHPSRLADDYVGRHRIKRWGQER